MYKVGARLPGAPWSCEGSPLVTRETPGITPGHTSPLQKVSMMARRLATRFVCASLSPAVGADSVMG